MSRAVRKTDLDLPLTGNSMALHYWFLVYEIILPYFYLSTPFSRNCGLLERMSYYSIQCLDHGRLVVCRLPPPHPMGMLHSLSKTEEMSLVGPLWDIWTLLILQITGILIVCLNTLNTTHIKKPVSSWDAVPHLPSLSNTPWTWRSKCLGRLVTT